MPLFLFADLHDSNQHESGLHTAFQQSLIDDPFHYLVADGKGDPDAVAIRPAEREVRCVVERFLAASFSYVGTVYKTICAPHFAAIVDQVGDQAILWEYVSASPFCMNLRAFNATSFEVYGFAEKLFLAI